MHLFIANIHLRSDSKEEAERFIYWFLRAVHDADGIYILDDLFDYRYMGLEERFHRWLPPSLKEPCARALVKSSIVIRPLSAKICRNIEEGKGVDTVICVHLHQYITRKGLIILPAFHDIGSWLAWDESGPHLCSFS